MWQAIRDIVNNAKESLGIEVPAVVDPGVITGIGDQVNDAVTTTSDTASSATADVAGTAAEAANGAGDAVAGAVEQITSKLSDLLGRLGR